MEVIKSRRDLRLYALVVHLTRAVDSLFQAIVKIVSLTALHHAFLVVELDLGNQETSKPSCIVVQTSLFLRYLDGQVNLPIAKACTRNRRSRSRDLDRL